MPVLNAIKAMSEKPHLNREYIRSFVFGTKLISLLILLVVPLFLWVALFSSGPTIIQKLPILYSPGLRILEIRNYPFRAERSAEDQTSGNGIIPINDMVRWEKKAKLARSPEELAVLLVKDFHFSALSEDVQGSVFDHLVKRFPVYQLLEIKTSPRYVSTSRALRNDEERGKLQDAVGEILADNRTKKEPLTEDPAKTRWYEIPWDRETVVHGGNTPLGTVVNAFGLLVITVVCLALYFPLFRAIFNLFKKKRIISA